MPPTQDILTTLGVLFAALAFIWVMRWRRRTFTSGSLELAEENVCEHLAPAMKLILERGSKVTRVGQNHPELPLEIHFAPGFDPKALFEELKLEAPVYLSERNVLYCKEDWCELHPKP